MNTIQLLIIEILKVSFKEKFDDDALDILNVYEEDFADYGASQVDRLHIATAIATLIKCSQEEK